MSCKDSRLKPYAGFLEECCKMCAEDQPVSCAFLAKGPDGVLYSLYFGEAKGSPYEKMMLASVAQTDSQMQIVMANADRIVQAADEIEDQEETGD